MGKFNHGITFGDINIGDSIKSARKEANMTQAELAEKCGVATITIRQYESSKRIPNIYMIERIAKILDVYWPTIGINDEKRRKEERRLEQEQRFQHCAKIRTNTAMAQMTDEGQNKVADYAEDILPRYKRPAPPQAPPHKKGDTTPEE